MIRDDRERGERGEKRRGGEKKCRALIYIFVRMMTGHCFLVTSFFFFKKNFSFYVIYVSKILGFTYDTK